MSSQSQFSPPASDRHFEDYVAGAEYEFGTATVDEDELIAFARKFDPQSIHIDRVAAENGPFKGLIASGWHTLGLMMRLIVDNYMTSVASLASPGIDEVRWLKPVRPGDRLRIKIRIIETMPSRSKPDRGIVRSHVEAINQDGIAVASFIAMNMIGRRPKSDSPTSAV